jgi:hypothetical protein
MKKEKMKIFTSLNSDKEIRNAKAMNNIQFKNIKGKKKI